LAGSTGSKSPVTLGAVVDLTGGAASAFNVAKGAILARVALANASGGAARGHEVRPDLGLAVLRQAARTMVTVPSASCRCSVRRRAGLNDPGQGAPVEGEAGAGA
jgi:hypothetical protein